VRDSGVCDGWAWLKFEFSQPSNNQIPITRRGAGTRAPMPNDNGWRTGRVIAVVYVMIARRDDDPLPYCAKRALEGADRPDAALALGWDRIRAHRVGHHFFLTVRVQSHFADNQDAAHFHEPAYADDGIVR
jgi:hypothetical protein